MALVGASHTSDGDVVVSAPPPSSSPTPRATERAGILIAYVSSSGGTGKERFNRLCGEHAAAVTFLLRHMHISTSCPFAKGNQMGTGLPWPEAEHPSPLSIPAPAALLLLQLLWTQRGGGWFVLACRSQGWVPILLSSLGTHAHFQSISSLLCSY